MPEQIQRQNYTGRPATLADHEQNDFKIQPICRRCWHTGPLITPRELGNKFGLPMTSAIPAVEARLRCTLCGERAGYLALDSPAVQARSR